MKLYLNIKLLLSAIIHSSSTQLALFMQWLKNVFNVQISCNHSPCLYQYFACNVLLPDLGQFYSIEVLSECLFTMFDTATKWDESHAHCEVSQLMHMMHDHHHQHIVSSSSCSSSSLTLNTNGTIYVIMDTIGWSLWLCDLCLHTIAPVQHWGVYQCDQHYY